MRRGNPDGKSKIGARKKGWVGRKGSTKNGRSKNWLVRGGWLSSPWKEKSGLRRLVKEQLPYSWATKQRVKAEGKRERERERKRENQKKRVRSWGWKEGGKGDGFLNRVGRSYAKLLPPLTTSITSFSFKARKVALRIGIWLPPSLPLPSPLLLQ